MPPPTTVFARASSALARPLQQVRSISTAFVVTRPHRHAAAFNCGCGCGGDSGPRGHAPRRHVATTPQSSAQGASEKKEEYPSSPDSAVIVTKRVQIAESAIKAAASAASEIVGTSAEFEPAALPRPPPTMSECLERLGRHTNTYYAVVDVRGRLYHITKSDLVTMRFLDIPIGTALQLDCVREFGSSDVTLRGHPVVAGVKVSAIVLQHFLSEEKYYPRKVGLPRHQPLPKRLKQCHYTTIRITDISYDKRAHMDALGRLLPAPTVVETNDQVEQLLKTLAA